jgi:hypothetical protein
MRALCVRRRFIHFAKSLSLSFGGHWYSAGTSIEIFLAISLLVRHPSLFHPFHIFHYSLLRSKQRTSHHIKRAVASWLRMLVPPRLCIYAREMKQNANKFAWLGLL